MAEIPSSQSIGQKGAFCVYDFGETQSTDFAKFDEISHSFKALGVGNIAHSHVSVLDVKLKESGLEALQEPHRVPWAMMRPPKGWFEQRRNLFGNEAGVSFGRDHEFAIARARVESLQVEQALQESGEDIDSVASTREGMRQKAVTAACEQLQWITDLIRTARARMGQFIGA